MEIDLHVCSLSAIYESVYMPDQKSDIMLKSFQILYDTSDQSIPSSILIHPYEQWTICH